MGHTRACVHHLEPKMNEVWLLIQEDYIVREVCLSFHMLKIICLHRNKMQKSRNLVAATQPGVS